jgi:hypothetical protein
VPIANARSNHTDARQVDRFISAPFPLLLVILLVLVLVLALVIVIDPPSLVTRHSPFVIQRPLLLNRDRRRILRVIPHQLQHAIGCGLLDGDHELIHRLIELLLDQADPRQVLALVVLRSPLACLLIYDQLRVPPIEISLSVVNSVASSAPIRQTWPKGTSPPQILRFSPLFGSFV